MRPEGLNTVTLLKIASSALGIGPQRAMHIAEALYLAGTTLSTALHLVRH